MPVYVLQLRRRGWVWRAVIYRPGVPEHPTTIFQRLTRQGAARAAMRHFLKGPFIPNVEMRLDG